MLQQTARSWTPYVVMLWVVSLYLYFTFTAPIGNALERYPELTFTSLQLLRFSIALPIILIWFGLLYGVVSVRAYALSLGEEKEGGYWKKIALGLSIFLVSMLFSSIISTLQQRIIPEPDGHEFARQIFRWVSLYSALLFSFTAYILLYQGSNGLVTIASARVKSAQKHIAIIIILLLMVILSLIIFNNPYRTVSDNPDIAPTYGIRDGLIVLTILIPYCAAWIIGSLAALNFLTFRKNINGSIYKSATKNFTIGIILVVSVSIFSQFIAQFGEYWAGAGLRAILILVYVLIGLILIGYLFIAKGAKKLKAIEQVPLDSGVPPNKN